jgi:hypothetical protein
MCGRDKRGYDSTADCSRATGDCSQTHGCDQTAGGGADECRNDGCCEDGDECCSGHEHEHAEEPNPEDECCSDDEPCVCDGKSHLVDLPPTLLRG